MNITENALSPRLVLFVPLYKRDAAVFPSDDARGFVCTPTGSKWAKQGYSFDGTDDYLTITRKADIDFGLTSFVTAETIMFRTIAESASLRKVANTSSAGYSSWFNGTGFPISYLTSTALIYQTRTGSRALSANKWFHVIRHYDRPNNTAHVYVNAQLTDGALSNAGGFTTTTDISNTQDLILAWHPTATDVYADLIHAELCIYTGDITPVQSLDLFLQAKKRMPWLV